MSLFENTVTRLLSEYRDLQQSKNRQAESPWHRKDARGGDAMNQQQVADRYKYRYTGENEKAHIGDLNSKIESMRRPENSKNHEVLHDADVNFILKNYPIKDLDKRESKKLGNTGLFVRWSRDLDKYILTKSET
jgi:hypothetical protein